MGWLPVLCLLLSAGLLGAIREGRSTTEIAWASSYSAGLKRAQRESAPLLLSFSTPRSGWCQKIDAETMVNSRVVAAARRYVSVRINSDVEPAIAARYGVRSYPTTILADSRGNAEVRFEGYITPERMITMLSLGSAK